MNGNIRTCYEYYSSIGNEEMKAKYDNTANPGTEKNPYALEDALDWCNIPSLYNSSSLPPYYEVVKDIDMNDCDKQTINSAVIAANNFSFIKIEGNGYSIRNLSAILQNVYKQNASMMYITIAGGNTLTISNLNFINIIRYDSFTSLITFSSSSGSGKIIFNNCNFTIYDYNRNGSKKNVTSYPIFINSCTFNYCTFNVKCALMYSTYVNTTGGNPHAILSGSMSNTFNYCHINIEYMHGVNPCGIINFGTYNFSYITLTINYLGQDDKTGNFTYNLFQSTNSSGGWQYYLRGSYIYIKFKSNTTIDRTDDTNTVGGPFLKLSIPGKDPTSGEFSYEFVNSSADAISKTTVPSFITVEDENKDDPNKYIDISELTHFKPDDIPDDGVYSINSTSSTLYYLTPENAKNYDILSKIDFPCLKV
ncbi:MAG: hypothetical protein ACI4V7_03105 [Succinivibrionaceae bacterium]